MDWYLYPVLKPKCNSYKQVLVLQSCGEGFARVKAAAWSPINNYTDGEFLELTGGCAQNKKMEDVMAWAYLPEIPTTFLTSSKVKK